jgi:hypothetical protein
MQAVAAGFSGYAGQFCCFFGEDNFKQFVFNSFTLKQALKWAWSAYLRAF